jgi:hypothetical protein
VFDAESRVQQVLFPLDTIEDAQQLMSSATVVHQYVQAGIGRCRNPAVKIFEARFHA